MGTNVVTPVVIRTVNTLLDNMFGIPKGPFHARPSSTNAVLLSPAQHRNRDPKGHLHWGCGIPQLAYRLYPNWGTKRSPAGEQSSPRAGKILTLDAWSAP